MSYIYLFVTYFSCCSCVNKEWQLWLFLFYFLQIYDNKARTILYRCRRLHLPSLIHIYSLLFTFSYIISNMLFIRFATILSCHVIQNVCKHLQSNLHAPSNLLEINLKTFRRLLWYTFWRCNKTKYVCRVYNIEANFT